MEHDNRNRSENVFSTKIRAGRRRTYFFDVRTTKSNDYYLTITESKKRYTGDGYERHKIFLYKEDFNKFLEEMGTAIDYIKERMPDFYFDAFNHRYDDEYGDEQSGDYRSGDSNEKNTAPPYVAPTASAPQEEEIKEEKEEHAERLDDPKPEDTPPTPPSIDPTINEDDLKW